MWVYKSVLPHCVTHSNRTLQLNIGRLWQWKDNAWYFANKKGSIRIPNGSHKNKAKRRQKRDKSYNINYCRTFFYVSVLPERQKRGTKRHTLVSKSYPLPQKTIRGYDCRKMAYFWRDLSILYLSHLQWLKLVLQSKKSEIMKNEKSTFSVLFYLKKDKMKKNGLVLTCPKIALHSNNYKKCTSYD